MDIGTVLAVGLAVLIAVLVRGAMTLADISSSLEELASRGGRAREPEGLARPAAAAKAAAAAAGGAGRAAAPPDALAAGAESGEAEIVAVIAVAREALAGALPLAH
jgi:hypothetical protein